MNRDPVTLHELRLKLDTMIRLQKITVEDLHLSWMRAAEVKDQLVVLQADVIRTIDEIQNDDTPALGVGA